MDQNQDNNYIGKGIDIRLFVEDYLERKHNYEVSGVWKSDKHGPEIFKYNPSLLINKENSGWFISSKEDGCILGGVIFKGEDLGEKGNTYFISLCNTKVDNNEFEKKFQGVLKKEGLYNVLEQYTT